MRVGPPEISNGKEFWPVQKPVYDVIPTWGERGTRREFSHWETVNFYETREAATEALIAELSS